MLLCVFNTFLVLSSFISYNNNHSIYAPHPAFYWTGIYDLINNERKEMPFHNQRGKNMTFNFGNFWLLDWRLLGADFQTPLLRKMATFFKVITEKFHHWKFGPKFSRTCKMNTVLLGQRKNIQTWNIIANPNPDNYWLV